MKSIDGGRVGTRMAKLLNGKGSNSDFVVDSKQIEMRDEGKRGEVGKGVRRLSVNIVEGDSMAIAVEE